MFVWCTIPIAWHTWHGITSAPLQESKSSYLIASPRLYWITCAASLQYLIQASHINSHMQTGYTKPTDTVVFSIQANSVSKISKKASRIVRCTELQLPSQMSKYFCVNTDQIITRERENPIIQSSPAYFW